MPIHLHGIYAEGCLKHDQEQEWLEPCGNNFWLFQFADLINMSAVSKFEVFKI